MFGNIDRKIEALENEVREVEVKLETHNFDDVLLARRKVLLNHLEL